MFLLVHYFSIFGFARLPSSVVLFSFLFFFSNLHFRCQYHSQLICVMPLNTCNFAQTLWVCFGAVIALNFHFFFCLAALYLFSTFFSNFALSMTALMLIRTVLQSAHLSDATEYLQPCTILISFFRSCKRTSTFLFFFFFIFALEFFLLFMISLQCWWIENLHRTTSLFEAHRLAFHSASLL